MDRTKSFFGIGEKEKSSAKQQPQQPAQQHNHNHSAIAEPASNKAPQHSVPSVSQRAPETSQLSRPPGQSQPGLAQSGQNKNVLPASNTKEYHVTMSEPAPAANNAMPRASVSPPANAPPEYAENAKPGRDSESSRSNTQDSTINRLSRIRETIFDKTVQERSDSPSQSGLASSAVAQASKQTAPIPKEEGEVTPSVEPRRIAKQPDSMPALPKTSAMQEGKMRGIPEEGPRLAARGDSVRVDLGRETRRYDDPDLETDDLSDDSLEPSSSLKMSTNHWDDEEQQPGVANSRGVATSGIGIPRKAEEGADGFSERDIIASDPKIGSGKNRSSVSDSDSEEYAEEIADSEYPMLQPAGRKTIAKNQPEVSRSKSGGRSRTAILEMEMNGPKKRIVGQESVYQFKIINTGGAAAEEVVVSIEMPKWAEIQSTDFNVGTTNETDVDNETHVLNWTIDRLEAGESQPLGVHLIPRQRKVLNMTWDYRFKQPIAKTSIEVQEAALEMALDGPSEMLWGATEMFNLRVRNSGNGDVEDLQLTLLPSGTNPADAEPYPMGLLKAGEEKSLTIKAWAKQQDFLDIKVLAQGAYGLQGETVHTVKVLRPELEVAVDCPEMQFVGNQIEYKITVRNHGTSPAKNVDVKALVPSGAKYVSNQGNGRSTPGLANQILWTVESIPAGEEFVCVLVCEMRQEGRSKLEVFAAEKTGKDKMGVSATAVATTKVESIANLSMRIENPQGPSEVGKPTTYSITVTNRGTKIAENVEIIAAFAEGIVPLSAEGGPATINDSSTDKKGGQVFFDPIAQVGPKQSVVLKVKARAEIPGNHKIRVEMICDAIGTHLAHEDSSYYYDKLAGEPSTEKEPKMAAAKSPMGKNRTARPKATALSETSEDFSTNAAFDEFTVPAE